MHSFSFPGSSLFRSRISLLMLATCGFAFAIAGCGSGSPAKSDAGVGGKGGGAGTMNTGGKGGSGTGGAQGVGGSGTGGTAGSGAGGAGTGGVGGAVDSGVDAINICVDAGEGGPGDTDSDGTADCLDGCPNDPLKQVPGACGCGVSDNDTDGDGVPDCIDRCPGAPDVDTDHDGMLDCLDGCPKDPARTTAGICGCGGVPDSTPLCLVHRYSFDGTTATIADSITITGVSPANGTAIGTVPANGRIVLAGGPSNQIGAQFVSLPAGTISTLGNSATFETWVTWNPVVPTTSGPWQRIFDFGSSDQPAGTPGTGQTYFFLSPANGINNRLRTAMTLTSNGGETPVDAPAALPTNTANPVHIAVVVDGPTRLMSLYVNGAVAGVPVALRPGLVLSNLNDVNNWFGRSQWAGDQLFAGSITEFRIYSAALSADQIQANFVATQDVVTAVVDGGTTTDGSTTTDGGTTADGGGTDADAASGQ